VLVILAIRHTKRLAAREEYVQLPSKSFWLSFQPSDRLVLAILALAVLVALARYPAVGHDLLPLLLLQATMLVGFAVGIIFWSRRERWWAVQYLRPLLTVSVIFTCYSTLGRLGMAAMPYRADAFLSELDNRMCGCDPSLVIQRFQTSGWVEFFSFIYGAFIPYIYLSMALGVLGRPPYEREAFLTGWVLLYSTSYLGYLFVPGTGPLAYHAADYVVQLQGGTFYDAVVRGVEASGGLQGAFPSLHVGGSLYLCLFDLRTHRLRGLTYLPMVLLIYLATLMLRYHYVVDLLAGTVLAIACIPLGQRLFFRWARQREAAGLPPLPGGESDAVSVLPGIGPADLAPVLPAP
jgi:hypothetical protein